MKIAIQGILGSYHDEVAKLYFGDDSNIIECLSFDTLVDSVKNEVADIGIMAIENSIAGSIIPNYSLIDNYELSIVGEYYISINHQLMALPGIDFSSIKTISSHPMALLQCKDFLKTTDKTIIDTLSPCCSARRVSAPFLNIQFDKTLSLFLLRKVRVKKTNAIIIRIFCLLYTSSERW